MIVDFDPNDMEGIPLTLEYLGPGVSLSSITAGPTTDGSYMRQTFTYTGMDITGVSGWVQVPPPG